MNATVVRWWILVFLLTGLLGACAQVEPYRRPPIAAPSQWQQQLPDAQPEAWPDREWWKGFQIAELDEFIRTAQENNHDLRAAAARVAQARAALRVAGSRLFPSLLLSAEAEHSKAGRAAAVESYGLGPEINYEIDIWGRNRNTRNAADSGVLSSIYAQQALRLRLTADVANAYFLILSLNDRIQVAEDNLSNARRLLNLVQIQRGAGRRSDLEVARQLEQVASREADIPDLVHSRQLAQSALAVLLARHQSATQIGAKSLRNVTLPAAPSGVPSRLVERRPDIRGAEQDLIAADANIAAARAALFPSLTLSASGGVRSNSLGDLFRSGTDFYSIGANLLGTIFDGGRLRAQVDLSIERRSELVEIYRQTIVKSFSEVENALSGVQQFALQERLLQEAVRRAREAFNLADARYKAGAVDFSTTLDAQRVLLAAEKAVDPSRLARYTSLVNLYLALGGGWVDPNPQASPARNPPAR